MTLFFCFCHYQFLHPACLESLWLFLVSCASHFILSWKCFLYLEKHFKLSIFILFFGYIHKIWCHDCLVLNWSVTSVFIFLFYLLWRIICFYLFISCLFLQSRESGLYEFCFLEFIMVITQYIMIKVSIYFKNYYLEII